jgi:hypothetical protein
MAKVTQVRCGEDPLRPVREPWYPCGGDAVGPHPEDGYPRPLCQAHMDLAWVHVLIRCDEAGLIRWPPVPENVVLGAS